MRLGKREQGRDEKRKRLGERKKGDKKMEKKTKHISIESKEEGKKGFKINLMKK